MKVVHKITHVGIVKVLRASSLHMCRGEPQTHTPGLGTRLCVSC